MKWLPFYTVDITIHYKQLAVNKPFNKITSPYWDELLKKVKFRIYSLYFISQANFIGNKMYFKDIQLVSS